MSKRAYICMGSIQKNWMDLCKCHDAGGEKYSFKLYFSVMVTWHMLPLDWDGHMTSGTISPSSQCRDFFQVCNFISFCTRLLLLASSQSETQGRYLALCTRLFLSLKAWNLTVAVWIILKWLNVMMTLISFTASAHCRKARGLISQRLAWHVCKSVNCFIDVSQSIPEQGCHISFSILNAWTSLVVLSWREHFSKLD